MATQLEPVETQGKLPADVRDMNWDPISRIVGNLGIYTKIDFSNRKVLECHSTSSIFRGYSIFMKGKDPRDSHFITSRICGICGDNHAVCSIYAQNMAYGINPPPLAEWIMNLGEAAEYMFDHCIFQDNLVFVDFCEQMVKETNPGLLARAEKTDAPHASIHGYKTIADIMRAFNPFTGELYREALVMSRLTREMFCLMEGRHVHPSTVYPGGVGTEPTIQIFTDYLVRMMKYLDFVKKIIPVNDDVFDFFYEALPGYEEVGRRRILLGCWGSFQNPDVCDYTYRNMDAWGRAMYVTPGIVVDGELVTTSLVDINVGLRILLGSSYYDDWTAEHTFVDRDPLGNPIDKRHPWNQTTIPKPQKRDFGANYTWVMSPRWYDKRTGDYLALDTGGGALARLWVTALAGMVDIGYVKATGSSVLINLPKTGMTPETQFEWKVPKWSNAIERDRARIYFIAYAAAAACHFLDKAMERVRGGDTKVFTPFEVPKEAIGCGFHEAVRGVLSHHMVIQNGKIANYHPYPPTPWNASPRDSYGTPGPYEDAVQGTPIFEENGPDNFKGIDIMRAVRSFDPCLPCGVHMYVGDGKTIEVRHSPTLGLGHQTLDRMPGAPMPNHQRTLDMSLEDRELVTQAARIDLLLQEIEAFPDPAVREKTAEIVQALLALYGEGLGRMLSIVSRQPNGESASAILSQFTDDDLVSHLLLLHDLHPVDVECRVERALDGVRPYLKSHGGDVQLVKVQDGIAHVRLEGHCKGCPSSAATLKSTVEEAIRKAAPELIDITAYNAEETSAAPANFVPLSALAAQVT